MDLLWNIHKVDSRPHGKERLSALPQATLTGNGLFTPGKLQHGQYWLLFTEESKVNNHSQMLIDMYKSIWPHILLETKAFITSTFTGEE